MVYIHIKEEFAEMMLDLKPHIVLFNKHAEVLSPYQDFLFKNWLRLYRAHFGNKGILTGEKGANVFKKWLSLFFSGLQMKNLEPHYKAMVEFGRELTDMGISLEEIIFSLHFFEEVSMPLLMKNYPDREKLTKMVFALDMLFHNELACLSMAYFYRYQSEIARLEKMKEDLTHMIVHDLKNPLNVVAIASDSLREEIKKTGKIEDTQYLEIISDSARNMWEMVNNMLDINRIAEGKFPLNKSHNNIEDIIKEVIESMKPRFENRKVKISFRKDNVPAFLFDRDVIKRVISNLLDNALKFSPAGKSVIISSRIKNDRVVVSVRDRGPGINKEDIDRIFLKFEQAGPAATGRIKGSGLGLTFCKMAVNASGGEIKVKSGKTGTTFSFYLPFSK